MLGSKRFKYLGMGIGMGMDMGMGTLLTKEVCHQRAAVSADNITLQ